MILQAKGGCYLTQTADVPIEQRHFVYTVVIRLPKEAEQWKEVTEAEKEKILQAGTVFDIDSLSAEYLDKVDEVLAAIPAHINDKKFSPAEALEHKEYYPVWGDENAAMGKEVEAGFRFRNKAEGELEYTLYEVIKTHTLSEEWVPGKGTESIYKVVSDAAGTREDPIPWAYNTELFEGLYYKDKDTLYLCIRSSGMGMAYEHLSDLVSGGFVKEDNGEGDTDNEADGTLEHPYPYTKGVTELVKDKYYIEDGVKYLCIQSASVQIYKLADMPSVAQRVEE